MLVDAYFEPTPHSRLGEEEQVEEARRTSRYAIHQCMDNRTKARLEDATTVFKAAARGLTDPTGTYRVEVMNGVASKVTENVT